MAENQGEAPINLAKPTKHPAEVKGYTELGAPEQLARSIVAKDIRKKRQDLQVGELKVENAKLEAESMIDSLTGLYNRRYFTEQLKDVFAETKRQHQQGINSEILVALFDLDKFKLVNDMVNYQAGDKVLVDFAKTMQGLIREEDVFARIGGEEFALIIKESHRLPAKEQIAMFRRILHAVESNVRVQFKTEERPMTVSIGVASFANGETGETSSDLMRNANEALKRAKKSGRNTAYEYEGIDPATNKPILTRLTPPRKLAPKTTPLTK